MQPYPNRRTLTVTLTGRSFGLSNDALTEVGTLLGVLFLLHAIAFLIVPSVRKDFSKTPHLAAHFVATLVGFFAFAAYGTSLWLATPYLNNEPCVTDHIGGTCTEGARLAHAMMAFQTYEVIPAASRSPLSLSLRAPASLILSLALTLAVTLH